MNSVVFEGLLDSLTLGLIESALKERDIPYSVVGATYHGPGFGINQASPTKVVVDDRFADEAKELVNILIGNQKS